MKSKWAALNIMQSYSRLKGNPKLSVNLELAFGIPFTLLTFYTSLYMKSQGLTDTQIGYIISIQFASAAIFALFGGAITDALGRKKTLLIFDLIAWPGTVLIWLLADQFWMFAVAAVVNSTNQIVMVAWTCFLIEDATSEERVAAFNLTNLLSQCCGIILPLGGLLIGYLGVAEGQRIILAFSAVILAARIIIRHRYTTETSIGKQILEERQTRRTRPKANSYKRAISIAFTNRIVWIAMLVSILFNLGFVAFSFTNRSFYYLPYLTEVLGLDKSYISTLGTISSIVMLVIFIFAVPRLAGLDSRVNLLAATFMQIAAFVIFILTPKGNYLLVVLSTVVYFAGFGIIRTFMDFMFADAAEGRERAGIYSITYVATSLLTAAAGPLIGYLFSTRPALVSLLSILILLAIVCLLMSSMRGSRQRSTGGEITKDIA